MKTKKEMKGSGSRPIVSVREAGYMYRGRQEGMPGVHALTDVSVDIPTGQFVVVLGRNGSGKSTLARLLNALLIPVQGTVWICGLDTRDEDNLWEIRRTAGMVFQNPDNQIVGTVVEEDVAFGPENIGIPPEEIRQRVDQSLKMVGISEYASHAPHLLSGGQKQRVAIAGILAMKPDCIILDEATSMLDPIGRREVMEVMRKLNREEGITVIHITHHMDEAASADRVLVIDRGRIVMDGLPKEVFSRVQEIKALGLDVPQVTELLFQLSQSGLKVPLDILETEGAAQVLKNAIVELKAGSAPRA